MAGFPESLLLSPCYKAVFPGRVLLLLATLLTFSRLNGRRLSKVTMTKCARARQLTPRHDPPKRKGTPKAYSATGAQRREIRQFSTIYRLLFI